MIPPEADAEFAASMEEVLETYQRPYDAGCPVVCRDEQPVQLVKETREPVASPAERPRRVDYEYERAGTAAVFLFCEPLAGWREATARQRLDENGLGARGRLSAGGTLRRLRPDYLGAGPSQHAYQGGLL